MSETNNYDDSSALSLQDAQAEAFRRAGIQARAEALVDEAGRGDAVRTALAGELAHRFTFHAPRPGTDDAQRHVEVRLACLALAQVLVDQVPPCRERGIAVQCIEDAMMWANAGLARNRG